MRAEVPAPDGNKALAIEWANKAGEKLDAGDFAGAFDAMQEAMKHARPPTFVVFLARVDEKLGRLLAAKELYAEVAALEVKPTDPKPFATAKEDAKNGLESMTARIPQLQITVTGDAAAAGLTLDGAALDASQTGTFFAVDPGKHKIGGLAGGHKLEQEIEVKEGTRHYVSINLTAATPVVATRVVPVEDAVKEVPSGSTTRLAGFVSLGVGGAGLLVGAVLGGVALSGREEARKACGEEFDTLHRCSLSAAGPLQDAQWMARASTGAFVAAGLAGALGLTLLVLAPAPKSRVGVAVSPGFAAVKGVF